MKIKTNDDICLLLDRFITEYSVDNLVNNKQYKQEFLNYYPDTNKDISKADSAGFVIMKSNSVYISAVTKILGANKSTNAIIYPSNSIMDWHTNSDLEGTRVYYTKTAGEAIFSYMINNKRYNDYDNIGGWTCRKFNINKDNLFWHAIWTERPRYSFGFLI